MSRWTCDACGTTIASGDGWIVVVDADDGGPARHVDERNRKPWPDVATASDLCRNMAEHTAHAAVCHAYHRACDPRPNGGEYWIHVERAATLEAWARWVYQLGEKNWMDKHDICQALAFWFENRGATIHGCG
jgi:hypothetical protein